MHETPLRNIKKTAHLSEVLVKVLETDILVDWVVSEKSGELRGVKKFFNRRNSKAKFFEIGSAPLHSTSMRRKIKRNKPIKRVPYGRENKILRNTAPKSALILNHSRVLSQTFVKIVFDFKALYSVLTCILYNYPLFTMIFQYLLHRIPAGLRDVNEYEIFSVRNHICAPLKYLKNEASTLLLAELIDTITFRHHYINEQPVSPEESML